jgi:hypothetical protein
MLKPLKNRKPLNIALDISLSDVIAGKGELRKPAKPTPEIAALYAQYKDYNAQRARLLKSLDNALSFDLAVEWIEKRLSLTDEQILIIKNRISNLEKS